MVPGTDVSFEVILNTCILQAEFRGGPQMNLADFLTDAANRIPDHDAVRFGRAKNAS